MLVRYGKEKAKKGRRKRRRKVKKDEERRKRRVRGNRNQGGEVSRSLARQDLIVCSSSMAGALHSILSEPIASTFPIVIRSFSFLLFPKRRGISDLFSLSIGVRSCILVMESVCKLRFHGDARGRKARSTPSREWPSSYWKNITVGFPLSEKDTSAYWA